MASAIRSKKLLSVRTARAIHSKKKLSTVQSFHPKTILFLATVVERSVILQVFLSSHIATFVYKRILNSHGSLLLCSHLHFHIIICFIQYLSLFFQQLRFPKIIYLFFTLL